MATRMRTTLDEATWDGIMAALRGKATVWLSRTDERREYSARIENPGSNQYGTTIPKVTMRIGQNSTSEQVWGYTGLKNYLKRWFRNGDRVEMAVSGGNPADYVGWRETSLPGVRVPSLTDTFAHETSRGRHA